MKTLRLALLISMYAATGASAQTAAQGVHDFSGLTTKRTLVVIDDMGNKARGRLLRFTPDQLTLLIYGREVSVERRKVAAVYEPGDSVWNGMLLGLLSGAGLGAVGLLTSDPVGDYAQAGAALMVLIGLGAGTAVDAMIQGKRLIYQNQQLVTYEQGDSIKSGIIMGLVAGGVTGLAIGATKDDCDRTPIAGPAYFTPPDCYASEKWAHGSKVGAVTGLAGAALGAVIDKLIVGRRAVYGAAKDPLSISIAPSISQTRLGLTGSVSW